MSGTRLHGRTLQRFLVVAAALLLVATGAPDPALGQASPLPTSAESAHASGDDRTQPAARSGARPEVGRDAVASHARAEVAASTLLAQRTEPVRARATAQTASVDFAAIQDYHDTCGDSQVGDLLGLANTDLGAAIGWEWVTCQGRGFLGTDDELLMMFVYDATLPFSIDPDYVIVQWPEDGFMQVFYAGRSSEVADWLLLENGFAPVYEAGGRVVGGRFAFDAEGALFPMEYEFEVATIAAGGTEDLLPKTGHPTPTFPTSCTTIVPLRAELVLDEGVDHDEVIDRIVASGATVRPRASTAHGIVLVDGVEDGVLERLSSVEGVRTVQRSRRMQPAQVADDWQLQQLNVTVAGGGVVSASPAHIAVIDDGVDALHPAVRGSVGAGFDAVAEQAVAVGRSTNMGYHGTGVASMIVGDGTRGVYGSNPLATIRPISVSSHDGCISTDRVVTAIVAAAEMPEVSVINLSLAGPSSFAVDAAVDHAERHGKLVVASSGNDQEVFPGQLSYPAGLPNVIGVGATSPAGSLASFSQTAGADILAPGEDVRLASWRGDSSVESGTSFSAPLVAGVLATWAADNPGATTSQARAALVAAGVPVAGSDTPLLDVEALLSADEEPSPPPEPDTEADGDAAPAPDPEPEPESDENDETSPESEPLPEVAVPSFGDIAGTTHEDAILAVARAGITGGFDDGTYRPSQPVTRGQMAAFLTRGLGLEPVADAAFSDVAGTTHEGSIGAVAAAGIAGGFPDGTYRPSQPVTRGQMATFLARGLGLVE